MDPSEIEFLAEEETTVSIVPNFSEGVLYLLSGDVGPLRAGLPVKVPLWMALNLRGRQKCRLLHPSWMELDKLEEVRKYKYFLCRENGRGRLKCRLLHPSWMELDKLEEGRK